MKRFLISSIIFSLLCLASCQGGGSSNSDGDVAAEAFTDTVYSPKYASGFCITALPDAGEDGGLTLITVRNPWQGAEDVETHFMIQPDRYPKRIVAMSSTHVAMLEAIGAADRIVGVSGKDYIASPEVSRRSDDIVDVGYEGNVDYEALVGARPDLVLLYAVSGPSTMEGKLDELGIPYLYIGDYLEESPLGKAEWMIALGAITGHLHQAMESFTPVEQNYVTLANMVESFGSNHRPKVMLNLPEADGWFLPSTDTYMARLIADAGGEYLFKDNSGNKSVAIDMERGYTLLSKADVWLNAGTASEISEIERLAPRLMDTPAATRGNVWNNNRLLTPGGGNAFFETGAVRPDVVLSDLVIILHPELMDTTQYHLTYYHRL